ncbi:YcgJ family protein [Serratia fonticola]
MRQNQKYLGKKQGDKLMARGELDRTVFTFANRVNCDRHARVCRKDRYRGGDGKPTGRWIH